MIQIIVSRERKNFLSPFAEYHGRKVADECDDFPLRRDSAPDEAVGRRCPDREVVGASLSFTLLVFVFLFLSIFPRKVCADVLINEFQLSPSNNQWIELFNSGSEEADISGWVIDDAENGSSSVFTIPAGTTLLPQKCISFKSSNFNWNISSADQVRLISSSGIEIYPYSKSPGDNISIGRVVDGQGDLTILSVESRDAYNSTGESCIANISTPSPSPSPTLVPTAVPTILAYKSTYKINKPKDPTGKELSGIQIYVDGAYIHHEDDEILYFFNGHECYTGIDCGLGTHTISLRKSGYISWEDTQNFSAGSNFEVNPVLDKLKSSSPTASPTVLPTSNKTPKPTPTKIPTPTDTPASGSAVLGIKEEIFTPLPSSTSLNAETDGKKTPFLPIIFIISGLIFIAVPVFSIIRNGKKDIEVS